MENAVNTEAAPVEELENAAPVVDSTAEQQQEPVEQAQPEDTPKTFTQEELDRIVQKRVAKESRKAARMAEMEAENRYLKQQMEAAQQKQAQPPQGEPKPEEFQDYEGYTRALARYEAAQEFAKLQQSHASQAQQQRQQQQAQEFTTRLDAKLSEGAEKFDDFDEVVRDPAAPISQVMYAIAAESEVGADLLYYLATHRDEAQKLFSLPPAAQARAVVKLEDKVTAPPKTTKAPPPITPTGQKAKVEKDPGDMSDKEFADWRRRQIAQRR